MPPCNELAQSLFYMSGCPALRGHHPGHIEETVKKKGNISSSFNPDKILNAKIICQVKNIFFCSLNKLYLIITVQELSRKFKL